MVFKERLKEKRTEANLTQVELAEKAGVTARTIQNYELGSRSPRRAGDRRTGRFPHFWSGGASWRFAFAPGQRSPRQPAPHGYWGRNTAFISYGAGDWFLIASTKINASPI